MNFLTPHVKEGYSAFIYGLAITENPHSKQLPAHFEWEAGWAIAKAKDARTLPEEQQIKQEPQQLIPPIDFNTNEAQYHMLTEFYTWLNSIDPRAREIILSLDTPEPTGIIGARQQYEGQLEVLLFKACNDGEDFVNLYVQVMAGSRGENEMYHRLEGVRLWNIVAMSTPIMYEKVINKQ